MISEKKKVEVSREFLTSICWSCEFEGDTSGKHCKSKYCNTLKCPNYGIGLNG